MNVCTKLKQECFVTEGMKELQAELDSELQATALKLANSAKHSQNAAQSLSANITTPAIKSEILKESSRISTLCREMTELDKQQAKVDTLEKQTVKGKLENILYSKQTTTASLLAKGPGLKPGLPGIDNASKPEAAPPRVFSAAGVSLLNIISDQEDIKRGLEQYSQEHKAALLDVSKAIISSYKPLELPEPEPEIAAHYKSKMRKHSTSAIGTPNLRKPSAELGLGPIHPKSVAMKKEVETAMQRINETLTLAEEMAADTPKAEPATGGKPLTFSKFAAVEKKTSPDKKLSTKPAKPTVSSAAKPTSSRK